MAARFRGSKAKFHSLKSSRPGAAAPRKQPGKHCFITRLHKFWNSQDVKFDYKQYMTGLHNRSMIT